MTTPLQLPSRTTVPTNRAGTRSRSLLAALTFLALIGIASSASARVVPSNDDNVWCLADAGSFGLPPHLCEDVDGPWPADVL